MTPKPTTDKQTNSWPKISLETECLSFKKRSWSDSISKAKLAKNLKKIEYIMKQGRDESKRPDKSGTKLYMGKKSSTGLEYLCLLQG